MKIEIKEQNRFFDEEKQSNGGGYHQPEVVFSKGDIRGVIDDSSCGDFGHRIEGRIWKRDKIITQLRYNTMENEPEIWLVLKRGETSILQIKKLLEEVGYSFILRDERIEIIVE